MERIIQNILISVAVLAASILLSFGIKKFRIKQSRQYGLFITTLLIVLSLAEFNSFCYSAENTDSSTKPVTQQIKSDLFNRINELNQFQEWKDFKAFWKKLDQIKPLYASGEYFESISDKEARKLRNNLKVVIQGLKQIEKKNEINPLEIELLERICRGRIDYMCMRLEIPRPLTRMSLEPPLWSELDRGALIIGLEQRIDKLIELKKKNIIDNQEFREALLNIQSEIKAFIILDTIETDSSRWSSIQSNRIIAGGDIGEGYILDYEKAYKDAVNMLAKGKQAVNVDYYSAIVDKYNKTKPIIEEIKSILPSFNELIADLEK